LNAITLDDSAELPLRSPSSPSELGELVRGAAGANQGLYPIGGRTSLDLGLPPLKPGVAVEMGRLNRVIDYPARDMTITVQAGITIAEITKTLDAEHQWLPIDVPNPDRATLGGAIATNTSGPRRLGYGTLRDYVIGISFIVDDGTEVKAGGRVVKNVAGYDLMKLHIGALGTLGVITQVTLKVKPKPEVSATVHLRCSREALPAALDRLHASKSRPVIAEIHNVPDGWAITLAFEEKKPTVAWQTATLHEELKADSTLKDGPAPKLPGDSHAFIWRANVRPSLTGEFCNTAVALAPGMTVQAHGLNGIVTGQMAEPLSLEAAGSMLAKLSSLAAEGNVVVRRCPPAWKKLLPIWGRPTADRDLMKHIKRTLDPNNVFNPGRLFGDL